MNVPFAITSFDVSLALYSPGWNIPSHAQPAYLYLGDWYLKELFSYVDDITHVGIFQADGDSRANIFLDMRIWSHV